MFFRKQLVHGYVHDQGAAMFGGVAGHAGIFSNANDLAKIMYVYLKNGEFHKNSDIPKLFINADPGSILVGDQREFVRSWQNLQEVTVKGNHFIQEHSPKEIGDALKNFLKSL